MIHTFNKLEVIIRYQSNFAISCKIIQQFSGSVNCVYVSMYLGLRGSLMRRISCADYN